jgi:prepilin peptidase CpaA
LTLSAHRTCVARAFALAICAKNRRRLVWHADCSARPVMSILLLVGLAVCVLAAVTDLWRGTIPNALTYPVLFGAPWLHFGLAVAEDQSLGGALSAAGSSVGGLALCSAVPLFMWWKGAIGGGDVKLFAAIGALLGPSIGFEAQLYVLLLAALLAPAKLAYDGSLWRSLRNMGGLLLNVVRRKHDRTVIEPALASWFRLGPCFALGAAAEVALHWGAR